MYCSLYYFISNLSIISVVYGQLDIGRFRSFDNGSGTDLTQSCDNLRNTKSDKVHWEPHMMVVGVRPVLFC